MLGFLNAPMGVAYHVVFAIAQFLAPLPAGLATAAAIVAFTLAVRLLLFPLSYHAFRGQRAMSELGVKAQELRARYASQPDRLQRELTELYRQESSGLLAGCLPVLLQLPFFSVMYRLFLSKTVVGHANGLLASKLLGIPLSSHWLAAAGPASVQGALFLGLFALLAAVSFVTARAARAISPATAPATSATRAAGTGQSATLGALGRILPYSTVIIAAFVPLAAGVYLLATTSWTAAERLFLIRRLNRGGMRASRGAESPAGPARSGPARRRDGEAAPSAARVRPR